MMKVIDLERVTPPDARPGHALARPLAEPVAPSLSPVGRGSALALSRAEGSRFLRFCCAGGVGFCVDASMLLWFVHGFGIDPIPARLMSAVVAILTTFELNRRWAFRGAGGQSYRAALAAYVGVQSLGLGCNVTVYAAWYLLLPPPLNKPLICLAAAAGAAMLLNYAGASRVVFRAR